MKRRYYSVVRIMHGDENIMFIQVAGGDLYNGILPDWPQSETTSGEATSRFRLGPGGKYSIIQVNSGDLYN